MKPVAYVGLFWVRKEDEDDDEQKGQHRINRKPYVFSYFITWRPSSQSALFRLNPPGEIGAEIERTRLRQICGNLNPPAPITAQFGEISGWLQQTVTSFYDVQGPPSE